MPPSEPNRRQLATYFAIAQVGLEMAGLGGLGVWLDQTLGWLPWASITGFVLGVVLGITHLVVLMKRADDAESGKDKVP